MENSRYARNSGYLFKHLAHQCLLDPGTAALPYQAVHIHLGNPTGSDMYLPVVAGLENQVVLFHYSNVYLHGHARGYRTSAEPSLEIRMIPSVGQVS